VGRVVENLQSFYICGQCNTKIFHLQSEEPDIPCPECGWAHGARKKDDIPSTIKIDLTQY